MSKIQIINSVGVQKPFSSLLDLTIYGLTGTSGTYLQATGVTNQNNHVYLDLNNVLIQSGFHTYADFLGNNIYDSSAAVAVSWGPGQRVLWDNSGGTSVDWNARNSIDISGNISTDWQNRILSGSWKVGGTITPKLYTVSTLPVGIKGMTAMVSDSLTPLSVLGVGSALTGSGTNTVPVYYNGSAWTSY